MGKFTFTQTEIPGVVVIEPQVFGDDRGYFTALMMAVAWTWKRNTMAKSFVKLLKTGYLTTL